ncbi:MAG: hypothetical protein AUG03_01575 [Acidobacteria bacterium 13_1_20CM_2_68_14]|nr:MAG: hypothetical protein AUG03_01575 [Acidobacteria bacterium 13_1_20CM_2_68_14]
MAMKLRMIVLLSLPVLFLGCAPGRLGGRPPDAPIAAEPAPDPAPSPATVPSPAPQAARIDFATQIRPLLQEKCSPCHFAGGRMYDRLPFDREETIRTLGKALFTRLRDPVDQELMRTFLEQPADGLGGPARP